MFHELKALRVIERALRLDLLVSSEDFAAAGQRSAVPALVWPTSTEGQPWRCLTLVKSLRAKQSRVPDRPRELKWPLPTLAPCRGFPDGAEQT